ncbi:MAG: glycosyltransferase family 4 protein [Myxococcales bacterium]|nr:glycosyltransferase family 4 protein [Myxococcales bacterium]
MRILIATSTFPLRPDDGLPRFVLDLAIALAQRDEVTVLAPGAPGVPGRERWDKVEIRRFHYFWPRHLQRLAYGDGMRENLAASRIARLQPPAFLISQVAALRRLLRDGAFDALNTHWLVPQGLSAALALRLGPRCRHVLSVHAGDVFLLERLPLAGLLSRLVLDSCQAVFADGSEVRERLLRLAGQRPSAEVQVQPMGIDLERFGAPLPPPAAQFSGGYLVFVGRLVEKKGARFLLQALPAVLERHPDLGLVVIGAGPEEQPLRRQAAELGIAGRVRFLGRLPHTEARRFFQHCRAAVVPSVVDSRGEADGMPTVVLEAMAAGARVVGSRIDGIPDLITDGENGWLAAPGDPSDLARAILAALADANPSPRAAAARESAARHDWREVAERYREALHG